MPVAYDRQIATVFSLVFHEWWRPLNMLIIGPSVIRVCPGPCVAAA